MKIESIFEMAKPAATCPKCGKGPMSKTHYWYKGGWRCKSEGVPANSVGSPTAPVKPAIEPRKSAVNVPTVEDIKAMLPPQNDYSDGMWGVSERQGVIQVYYSYTFRRNTALGAYQENKALFNHVNDILDQIAGKYPNYLKSVTYADRDHAEELMARQEANGDEVYSEYEQSFGGGVTLNTSR